MSFLSSSLKSEIHEELLRVGPSETSVHAINLYYAVHWKLPENSFYEEKKIHRTNENESETQKYFSGTHKNRVPENCGRQFKFYQWWKF